VDCAERYCIVGAGSSGLAVAKNFRQAGIAFDCCEREDDVGGNWYYGSQASSVYRSAHLISSKKLTEYPDFPMPDAYPPYPSQRQAWGYLRSYAENFGLYECVQFNTAIERVEPHDGAWDVHVARGGRRSYRGVVIANGHNWDPRWPKLPGEFHGTMLHSRDYKTPDILQGKRVLVIGAGNSGCDIAVESAQHARQTLLSMRRGYHFLPKFVRGKPVDLCGETLLRLGMPLWLRRAAMRLALRLLFGSPQDYRLPTPDHRLLETHPILNSQLPYYSGHGKIDVKPDVAELCGQRVRFADGSVEPVDLIVCATGYKLSFPFIERRHLDWHNGRPDLYLNVFHRRRDDLFVAGLIQPDSGQWGLVDQQAQLIARFIRASRDGRPSADRFRRLKRTHRPDLAHGVRYVRSPRHLLEVEHFAYRRRLRRLIAQLS